MTTDLDEQDVDELRRQLEDLGWELLPDITKREALNLLATDHDKRTPEAMS